MNDTIPPDGLPDLREAIVVDNWKAKLAIVTPGHQHPTGVVLPRDRRLALLN
jgi:DNA-binding transcriptional MocR family regulator